MPRQLTGSARSRMNKRIQEFTRARQFQVPKEILPRALAVKTDADLAEEEDTHGRIQWWNDLFGKDEKHLQLVEHPDDRELDQMSRKVAQAWLRFQEALPKEQAADMRGQPPSLAFLERAVQATQESLASKRDDSVFKRRLETLCKRVDNYEYLLKPIPTSDKYVSLVIGSLGALVKATVNHADVAEGIADGLTEISDDVHFWCRKMKLYSDSPMMWSYIRKLYVTIFSCFADIFTKWQKSSWARFKGSFDKNALKSIIGDHRMQMKELEHKLEREAHLENTQRLTDIQKALMLFKKPREDVQLFQESVLSRMQTLEKALLLLTGTAAERVLQDDYLKIAIEPRQHMDRVSIPESGASKAISSQESKSPLNDLNGSQTARAKKQDLFGELTDHIKRMRLVISPQMPLVSANDLHIERGVFEKIKTWTKTSGSSFLWIEGPSDVEMPSKNTLTASSLVAIAQRSKTPYVAYFASPTLQAQRIHGLTSGSNLLSSLVYTLISQLLSQMPETVPNSTMNTMHFLSSRLGSYLDGSEASITHAIPLLRGLLNCFIGPVLCIIDGFENVTYGLNKVTDESHIYGFIRSLCPKTDTDTTQSALILKTCFTTDGYVESLARVTTHQGLSRVSYEDDAEASESDEDTAMMENL